FLVYPYNAFLILALAAFSLIDDILSKRFYNTKCMVIGGLLGLVVFFVIIYSSDFTIKEYISFFINRNEERNETAKASFSVMSFVNAITQITNTNFIRYNLVYLFAFFVAIFYAFKTSFSKNKILFLMLFII